MKATSRLNQQMRRDASRFPPDLVFGLTRAKLDSLKLQIATSKGRGAPGSSLPWGQF